MKQFRIGKMCEQSNRADLIQSIAVARDPTDSVTEYSPLPAAAGISNSISSDHTH